MKRALLLLVPLLAPGCKRSVDTAPIAAAAAGLQQHENELVGRRGALQRERTEISQQRKALLERRARAGADGQATLDEEDQKLTAKESALDGEESAVNQRLDELLRARAELVQRATSAAAGGGTDPSERAAQREVSAADREKGVARREADVAEREQKLAEREAGLARREKETCSATPVVVAAAAPKLDRGTTYSSKDVEPLYARAQKLMQERGILASDLPPGTSGLVDETRQAMKAADWTKAKYAAEQLLHTVEGMKIDRNFIAAKMARLSAAMRGKKLDGEAGKGTEALFRDATANYGDGRFSDANGKINKLFALLK